MITKTGQEALEKDAWLSGALKAGKSLLSKGKSFLSRGASKSTGSGGAKSMGSSPSNFTTSSGSVSLGGSSGKGAMGKAKDMLSGAGTRSKWALGGGMLGAGAVAGGNKASPKKTRTPTGPPNQMM